MPQAKVAIVYLSFHSDPYLADVISAFEKISYPKNLLEFVVVDNPHPEFGSSMNYLSETLLPLSGQSLPHVTLLPQPTNRGFAGGCNAGIHWALEHGFDYVYLHNSDGFVSSNFLEPLVNACEGDTKIGAAQSLMLLYPDTNLVNSAGNAYHYLGIGYCNQFRSPKNTLTVPAVFDSGYVSGAALLLRADMLQKFGALDEDYFLYHEDLEYSLRLKSLGYRTVVVRDSLFYHKYNFSRNAVKFYFIERNRLGLLLSYYSLWTLFLLLPMMLVWEVGMLLFALRGGWFMTKLRTYAYWCRVSSWKLWLGKRKSIQKQRAISDKILLKDAASIIQFNEKNINTPLLRLVANPLLAAYWWVIKRLIV